MSLRPYRDATDCLTDPVDHRTARILTEQESRYYGILPWCQTEETIFIATSGPPSDESLQWLNSLQRRYVLQRTLPEDLEYAQDRVYGVPAGLADSRLGGILLTMERIQSRDLLEALQRQPTSGGRIGSILTSDNRANHWDIAEGLARQLRLTLVALYPNARIIAADPTTQVVWGAFDQTFWSRNLLVPVSMDDQCVTVATADPGNTVAIEQLSMEIHHSIRLVVTGYRDVLAIYRAHFGEQHESLSRDALLENMPDWSAHIRFSWAQRVVIISLLAVLGGGFVWFTLPTAVLLNVLLQGFYIANSVVRLWWILRSSHMPLEVAVTEGDMQTLDRASLPVYTILVPLYQEASVLPTIKEALLRLDYPKDRLDVKFLLESDDVDTIAAALTGNLPNYVDFVIVPPSEPKTKPKACNYGLHQARGEYVVIFDAEDIPEPDQLLKAVSVFHASSDKVACVQAKLNYYNGNQNTLTRWFAAEYAMWFDLLLPALYAADMPIPLGGTSNHFKMEVLRDVGGWDPYNVTEDADLGVRLHRAGFRTVVMNSTTHEEANSEFVNWVRQRSRWVKGYLQTWLVHMRHPIQLWRDLGTKGFLGYQIIIGGTPLTFLLNPVLWALTTAWFTIQTPIAHALFPSWVYYLSFVNLLLGNFAFTYANITGMARRRSWGLVKYAALAPIYWTYMSIAAWKGAWQLITRPSYWEKTVHGLNTEGTTFTDAV